jgi:hypothetical protein
VVILLTYHPALIIYRSFLRRLFHEMTGCRAALRESLSVSIGDLWPEIENLGMFEHEGISTATKHGHPEASVPNSPLCTRGLRRKIGDSERGAARSTLLDRLL